MKRLTRIHSKRLVGAKSGLNARLWPNGECQIWKPKSFKPDPLPARPNPDDVDRRMSMLRLWLECPDVLTACVGALGLSPHTIFDKPLERYIPVVTKRLPKPRAKKGNTGITAYGGRMVRNAAKTLEEKAGKSRCIFATVTLPDLPVEKMRVVHENWHHIVERYRLLVKRALQDKGLSGEIVSVSEIQERRYQKSGLPILHLHSVFAGVTAIGRFAITPELHDNMWYRALNVAVNVERAECTVACNLQRVKKSASSYLGKYMTKGSQVVRQAVNDGFASWVPNHWWNCTRTLSHEVKSKTRRIDCFAYWLNDIAETGGSDIWEWHRDVSIEMPDGREVIMAKYGRLTPEITAQIMNSS